MTQNPLLTRRNLMKLGVIPATGGLAGCIGGDDGEETDTTDGTEAGTASPVPTADPSDLEGVRVEGQTLRMPMGSPPGGGDPSEFTFLFAYDRRWHEIDSNLQSSSDAARVCTQGGMAGRFMSRLYWEQPGQTVMGNYSDFQINTDTIEITIADDAYWSDGEPVRAKDIYGNHVTSMAGRHMPEQGTWNPPTSAGWWSAVYSYDLPDGPDGKKVVMNVQPDWEGGFDLFTPGELMYSTAYKFGGAGLGSWPTHVEPYKSIADDAIELFEMKDTDPEELKDHELWMDHNGRVEKHVTPELLEEFRNGDKVVTNGAWTVDEIVGTEGVRLVPNEHHRGYDLLNFDEVFLEYSEEDERTIASLASNRFDFAQVNVRPSVADQFADAITQKTAPATYGKAIGLNHRDDRPFSDHRVRHAMMYALNKEDIATNIHPTAGQGITIPGWDNWGISDILDESWKDNLTDYSQDLDEAERLMQEAGLERNSSDQWTYEDEPIELTLPTAEQSPIHENTFASQMDDFGITVEVQPMDEATHSESILGQDDNQRVDEKWGGSSEYDIWSFDTLAYGFAGNYNHLWMEMYRPYTQSGNIRAWNWYDHDAQEDIISGEHEGEPVFAETGDLRTRSALEPLTIEFPAVGEPDGDLTNELPASYMGGLVSFGSKRQASPWPEVDAFDTPDDEISQANAEHWVKTWSWFVNWFMPALPLTLSEDQLFVNTGNWLWPNELEGEGYKYLWQYFNQWNPSHLASQNRVLADPENPKGDAEVVER